MPDGLLQPLSRADIADLFAYLMGDTQIEMAEAGTPPVAAPPVNSGAE